MKKISLLLIMLPLMAALFSCSGSEEDVVVPQPDPEKPAKVTFKATLASSTRVSYEEQSGDGKIFLKSSWEESDKTIPVLFKEDATGDTYKFAITEITDDKTAVLTYSGKVNDDGDTDNTVGFPEPFTGTATFKIPQTGAQVQGTDAPTAHLSAGTSIRAELENVSASNTSTIHFSHLNNAIFRITFAVPVHFNSGATLLINAGGVTLGEVKFSFPLNTGTPYTAYIRGEVYGYTYDELHFILLPADGDTKAHVCDKTLSATDFVPESGKMYRATISNPNDWKETDDPVLAEVQADAPDYIHLIGGIPLDENHELVDLPVGATPASNPSDFKRIKYFLYIADDVLRKPAEEGKKAEITDDILYFYWGEREGHKRNSDGTKAIPEDFEYGTTVSKNHPSGWDVQKDNPSMSFYINIVDWGVEYQSQHWDETYLYRRDNLMYYATARIPKPNTSEVYYWELNAKEELDKQSPKPYVFNTNSGETARIYKRLGDAAAIKWGGNWRMMNLAEVKAFMNSVTEKVDGVTVSQPQSYDGKGVQYTYKYFDKYEQKVKTTTVTLPHTGYILIDDDNDYYNDFTGYKNYLAVAEYRTYYEPFLWSWLRSSVGSRTYSNHFPSDYEFAYAPQHGNLAIEYESQVEFCRCFSSYIMSADNYEGEGEWGEFFQNSICKQYPCVGLPILPCVVVPKR